MKLPMYALLISPDEEMRRKIIAGEKTVTIREGHRDYKPGLVMLCCHLVPWAVMADITSVRHCTLGEVAEKECQDEGSRTQKELLATLQKYYPNITLDSPVTVIRWRNVRGFLVDGNQK